MNHNPTAPDDAATQVLRVSELFRSLQGEGRHAGQVCWFIRLAGCNLSCPWCDTPYTWKPGVFSAADRAPWTIGELLERIAGEPAGLVEVTGGEPLLQRATPALLTALADRGYEVILDTSGSLSIDGLDPRVAVVLDLKCPASGQSDRMDWGNLELLRPGRDEVKFVIADRGDYEWAREITARHSLAERLRVIYSPVTPLEIDLEAWTLPRELAAWMLADNSPATLQLQLHRIIWPRAVRGTEEGYR